MSTLTSPFAVKKVVQPMKVWQFDETQVTPLPDNEHFYRLPVEVEQAFEDAGYSVIIVNSQEWGIDENQNFVHKGAAIEATITFRNNSRLRATVTHGQYVAFGPDGEITVVAAEDVLP